MKYATVEAFEFADADVPSADSPSRMVSRFFATVNNWRERSKSRAQLAAMSDHTLTDIGITRGEAMFEANKHFWEE